MIRRLRIILLFTAVGIFAGLGDGDPYIMDAVAGGLLMFIIACISIWAVGPPPEGV